MFSLYLFSVCLSCPKRCVLIEIRRKYIFSGTNFKNPISFQCIYFIKTIPLLSALKKSICINNDGYKLLCEI